MAIRVRDRGHCTEHQARGKRGCRDLAGYFSHDRHSENATGIVTGIGYEALMTNAPPEHAITRRGLLTTGAARPFSVRHRGGRGLDDVVPPARTRDLESAGPHGAPPVGGLHLQFGKNAGTEVVVSWHTTDAVGNPRVMLGTRHPASAAP